MDRDGDSHANTRKAKEIIEKYAEKMKEAKVKDRMKGRPGLTRRNTLHSQ
ncbi:hypothetical protein B7P43_G10004 [Cryptotermes secundus]|uniref:Uncharacterized protein n=1 Tax=Cryptotermes secundus TaxID=105785 RepID=A0A2J7RFK3_9NEOP|nr:hypothetical protein B7P43_G10004 [Cryptotermes secundus]